MFLVFRWVWGFLLWCWLTALAFGGFSFGFSFGFSDSLGTPVYVFLGLPCCLLISYRLGFFVFLARDGDFSFTVISEVLALGR
jgi:hypothetical protein